MPTVIKYCVCASPYQDKKYGKGKRVMNTVKGKDGSGNQARCTVCGKMSE